ncbi:MAG TPA: ATP-binding protein [Opitutaceae bacterium]|nr:ATP-binding protein [Opitutaceae bacterium]
MTPEIVSAGDFSALADLLRAAMPRAMTAPPATAGEPSVQGGLRMAEARYRTLVELLPAITFMATFDEGLSDVYVSPQIESLLGYSQKQWLEEPILWYERLHADDRDRWNREFARTISSGEPLRSAYRVLTRAGKVVWLQTEVRIARDDQNRPAFIHGIAMDVTATKEAEQRVGLYAKRLEQTNTELEKFAYVASHDLQEPLRSMLSYSQILREDYGDKLDAEALQHLQRISTAGLRMKELILALLQFSKLGRDTPPVAPTDFNQVVAQALGNLDATIRETGAIVKVDSLPTTPATRDYMVPLFQNLIGNALKFRSAETPRIEISAARQGDHWEFSVRDNGIGIEREYHARIFEIFQRLHTQAQIPGTGIGLAVCKKIVDLHKGRIWVESEPGKGSIFRFTLPATLTALPDEKITH